MGICIIDYIKLFSFNLCVNLLVIDEELVGFSRLVFYLESKIFELSDRSGESFIKSSSLVNFCRMLDLLIGNSIKVRW